MEHTELIHAQNHSSTLQNVTCSGHIVPGTLFGHLMAASSWLVFGLLYIILAQYQFYSCRRRSQEFVSSVELPIEFFSGRLRAWPVLATLKIVASGSYLVMEFVTAAWRPPGGNETPYWQHDTTAAAFLLSGVADILCIRYSKRGGNKAGWVIPRDADFTVFAVTFAIQALLLFSHLHGRSPVDVRVHQIHGAIVVCCLLAVLAEARFRRHVMMPVLRGYFVLLQATWVINVGFVLYHPFHEKRALDLFSHEAVAVVSLMFVYNVILNMVVVMTINLALVWTFSGHQYKFVPSQAFDSLRWTTGYRDKRRGLALKHRNGGAVPCTADDRGISTNRIDQSNSDDSEDELDRMELTKSRKT